MGGFLLDYGKKSCTHHTKHIWLTSMTRNRDTNTGCAQQLTNIYIYNMYYIYTKSIIYIHLFSIALSPCGCISCSYPELRRAIPNMTTRISSHAPPYARSHARLPSRTPSYTRLHAQSCNYLSDILLIRPHKNKKKHCRGKRSCWTTCKKSLGKGCGAFSGKRRHTRGNGIGGVLKIF